MAAVVQADDDDRHAWRRSLASSSPTLADQIQHPRIEGACQSRPSVGTPRRPELVRASAEHLEQRLVLGAELRLEAAAATRWPRPGCGPRWRR